jgi:hypothetical protein
VARGDGHGGKYKLFANENSYIGTVWRLPPLAGCVIVKIAFMGSNQEGKTPKSATELITP